ncbi:S8 family peptidase [Peribacillus sp. SCS-155]|uniref:S8 family peptidase n=1 Tax=Peribacillus sedimenti TaxID=3115297 RepID=UPI0039062039
MRKISSLLLSLTLLLPVVPDLAAASVNASSVSSERVIVVFKDKTDQNAIKKANAKVKKQFKHIKALTINASQTSIKQLRKDPDVLSIEKDIRVQVKSQYMDWGTHKIQAASAWKTSLTGKGVKVSVIDTGIANHPDLALSGGTSVVSYTSSYADDNGHGTHVAGIIGAKNNTIGTVGVAPDASLYAVKALDGRGSGYLSDIIAGIDWSIQNKMDIINLSLGIPTPSYALADAVDRAYNQGILVVAAAGNDGTADGSGDTVDYPAKFPSAIAVSATDEYNNRGIFSSSGDSIEVAAPGVNIVSTFLNGSYARASGTSMAAPFAAGALALLKEANPAATNIAIREKLKNYALDLGTPGRDSLFGYGLVQAHIAVQAINAEPLPKKTLTALKTNKKVYYARERVDVTVAVTDGAGNKLHNAFVDLSVTFPNGKVAEYQRVTNNKGILQFAIYTSKRSQKGLYTIRTATALSGYETSSASTVYTLK